MPLEFKLGRYLPHDMARLGLHMLQPKKYNKLKAMRQYQLRPFIERKILYIHIPKCAGTSVVDALFGQRIGNHQTLALLRLAFTAKEFQEFYKFTFVRNPWDRMVSTYYYLRDGGKSRKDVEWAEKMIFPYSDFRDFVLNGLSENNINRSYHFRPQQTLLCLGPNRLPEMDYIGRFETLEQDFRKICEKIGVDARLPDANRGRSRPRDYRDQYDEETRAKVEQLYANDIALFNYKFD
jgi:hypothetical protein